MALGSLIGDFLDTFGITTPLSSRERAKDQTMFDVEQNKKLMDYQFSLNQQGLVGQRSWEEYMSNTAHQREVKDLKAAGLNPVLSASRGASTPSTSAASASGSSVKTSGGDNSFTDAIISVAKAFTTISAVSALKASRSNSSD